MRDAWRCTEQLRPQATTLITAIKELVLKIHAHADPEEPGSEALAERLLRPLVRWHEHKEDARKPNPASPPTDGSSPGA